jgi:hypothetical protein
MFFLLNSVILNLKPYWTLIAAKNKIFFQRNLYACECCSL